MGRTPLGPAARNTTVSVRLTKDEKIELARRFGTPTKGLRNFIDTVMAARREEQK